MVSRRRNRSADERERRERQDGITRRDFLDGTAVTAAGLAMAAAAPGLTGAQAMAAAQIPSTSLPAGYYPPVFESPNTGLPDAVIDRTFKLDGPPITTRRRSTRRTAARGSTRPPTTPASASTASSSGRGRAGSPPRSPTWTASDRRSGS